MSSKGTDINDLFWSIAAGDDGRRPHQNQIAADPVERRTEQDTPSSSGAINISSTGTPGITLDVLDDGLNLVRVSVRGRRTRTVVGDSVWVLPRCTKLAARTR